MQATFYLRASYTSSPPESMDESFSSINVSFSKVEDLPYQPQVGWKKKILHMEGLITSILMGEDGSTLEIDIKIDELLTTSHLRALKQAGWKDTER